MEPGGIPTRVRRERATRPENAGDPPSCRLGGIAAAPSAAASVAPGAALRRRAHTSRRGGAAGAQLASATATHPVAIVQAPLGREVRVPRRAAPRALEPLLLTTCCGGRAALAPLPCGCTMCCSCESGRTSSTGTALVRASPALRRRAPPAHAPLPPFCQCAVP
eukprot:2056451-Prymnesium_polylepis.1